MDGFAYPDLTEYREALALHTAVYTATAETSNARAQATNAFMDTLMFLASGLHPAVLAHAKIVHALHEEQIQFFRNAAWTASGKHTDVAMALFDAQVHRSQLEMRLQQATASSDASKAAVEEMATVVANVRAENARLQAALQEQQAAMAAMVESVREEASEFVALVDQQHAQMAATIAAAHSENARLQEALDQRHAAMDEERQAANQRADQLAQRIKTTQHERDSLRRQLTKLRDQVRQGAAAVPVGDGGNAPVDASANANADTAVPHPSENGVDQDDQAARPQDLAGVNRRQQARAGLMRPTKASQLRHAAIQQEREAKKKAMDAARAKDVANATTPDRTRTRAGTAVRRAAAVVHAAANPACGARH